MNKQLYEQFERDLEDRREMDRAWVMFLDMLTTNGFDVDDDVLDEELRREAEEDEPDPWADGTLRDGIRGFTGGKP